MQQQIVGINLFHELLATIVLSARAASHGALHLPPQNKAFKGVESELMS